VVHRNTESLYEHVPRSALPNWLGGNHADESEVFDCELEMKALDRQDYYENLTKKIAEDLI